MTKPNPIFYLRRLEQAEGHMAAARKAVKDDSGTGVVLASCYDAINAYTTAAPFAPAADKGLAGTGMRIVTRIIENLPESTPKTRAYNYALVSLGLLYVHGHNVTQDLRQAALLFEKGTPKRAHLEAQGWIEDTRLSRTVGSVTRGINEMQQKYWKHTHRERLRIYPETVNPYQARMIEKFGLALREAVMDQRLGQWDREKPKLRIGKKANVLGAFLPQPQNG